MLVPGILGFQGILLISFIIFFIIIREKWRNAGTKKAEVTKLVSLTSEETFTAEVQTAKLYTSILGLYHCAVCYRPTTTRCARCKAVRYCSGKCQIFHWRQGHKYECHPPSYTMLMNEASDCVEKPEPQKQSEIDEGGSEIEGIFEVAPEASTKKDDDIDLRPPANAEGMQTDFSSSYLSQDGFASSTVCTEPLVDAPANDAHESSTTDGPERPASDVVTPDMPGTRDKIKKTKQTMSSSLDSTDSVLDGTLCTSELDKMKSSYNDEDNIKSQHSEGKIAKSSDVQPANFGDEKSIEGATSLEMLAKDVSKIKGSSSLSSSRSDCITEKREHSHKKIKGKEEDMERVKGKKVSSFSQSECPASASGDHLISSSKSLLSVKASTVPILTQHARNGLKTSVRRVVQQLRTPKPAKPNFLGLEDEVTGKCYEKTTFPYDLFMKLYSYDQVELCPFGLTNVGNSCYANVVLQCLAFTRPLTSYLVQGLHSRACQKKQWCFICEFERLISKAREGNSPLSPSGILSKIQKIASNLGNGKEEDAHEFLRCAVDSMQSVFVKEAGAKGPLAEETTLIGLTFGGYLRSKIKCLKCLSKSEQYERMMDLTVEIDGDIETLEDALAQFTDTETLFGENKYYCSRCKSYERAKKKLTVLEEPNILTIVLKRFESGNFGKLNKSVRFPEVLSLAPYMSGTRDESPLYSLYAVVVHLDVMDAAYSGHYVCYVKNAHAEWFKIDDSTVMPVDAETVLLGEAYMLLYARHSPRPHSLLRNNGVSHGVKSMTSEALPSSLSNLKSNSKAHRKLGSTSNHLFDREEWRYHSMPRIPTVDSSSEISSIFSGSDVSSCSTKDSSRSEDFSDFIFGEVGRSWYSRYGISLNSVASSSLHQNLDSGLGVEHDVVWRQGWRGDSGKNGKASVLYADPTMDDSNLSHQFLRSSSRDIDYEQIGWTKPCNLILRRSTDGRSAQTFY